MRERRDLGETGVGSSQVQILCYIYFSDVLLLRPVIEYKHTVYAHSTPYTVKTGS